MKLLVVNVLIYAHREESLHHEDYGSFLRKLAEGDSAFGLSEAVLSGFVRIVTNPMVAAPGPRYVSRNRKSLSCWRSPTGFLRPWRARRLRCCGPEPVC